MLVSLISLNFNGLNQGVDFVGVPGQEVYACESGRVRIGNVYQNSTKMKLVEIKNSIVVKYAGILKR
mgnify:CR=1 FL=1